MADQDHTTSAESPLPHRFPRKDLTGQRFGRLLVLGFAEYRGLYTKAAYWHVICDCGTAHIVAAGSLLKGDTKSCGCLRGGKDKDQSKKTRQLKQAAYYILHSDQLKAYSMQYYASHKEHCKARTRVYKKNHPEISITSRRSRRARISQAPINNFTHAQWVAMQETFNHRCAYCGRRAKGHLTQDHITPLSKGGSHTLSNIVPACRSCNSKKGTNEALNPVQPLLLIEL